MALDDTCQMPHGMSNLGPLYRHRSAEINRAEYEFKSRGLVRGEELRAGLRATRNLLNYAASVVAGGGE